MNVFVSELQSKGWFYRELKMNVCLLNLARIHFLFSVVPVVHCPALAAPQNGFFIQNVCNNHFDAACGIRCQPDYDLQGTSIRLCQADGTWSGTPASCAGEQEATYTSSNLEFYLYKDRLILFILLALYML